MAGSARRPGSTAPPAAMTRFYLEEIPRASHRDQRDQPLLGPVRGTRARWSRARQPARRPLPVRRVAPPDQPVGAAVMPGVLDHPAELLRPEAWTGS